MTNYIRFYWCIISFKKIRISFELTSKRKSYGRKRSTIQYEIIYNVLRSTGNPPSFWLAISSHNYRRNLRITPLLRARAHPDVLTRVLASLSILQDLHKPYSAWISLYTFLFFFFLFFLCWSSASVLGSTYSCKWQNDDIQPNVSILFLHSF